MQTKCILLVDDERQILSSLRRVFSETNYEMLTASSGAEALEILAVEKVDLLISDMRMPNMDGHTLLKKVKQLYPATIRIILSGYADETQIFKSLLDGSSKMYLLKPWDNDKLLQLVDHMFQIQNLLNEAKLLEIVNRIDGLSTLGKIYHKLVALIEADAEVKEIAALIESDPAVAARVLHFTNSAFYGTSTGSIRQAIVYLGLQVVKEIVLTVSVLDSAATKMLSHNRLMLWNHAGKTSQFLSIIYKKMLNKKLPDSWATAGLLHDIGSIFLINQFPQEYMHIANQLQTDKSSCFFEMEKQLLGVSHQELGGYLLNWWDIPYPIIEATLFHHNPSAIPIVNKELVCAVHIADYFAWKLINKTNNAHLDNYALHFLGISNEECVKMLVD